MLINSKLKAQDKNLQYLLENPRLEKERQFLERLWKRFEPYADRQFRIEIASSFHQRYWEMYVACSLMECGFELRPKTWRKGPDLCIQTNSSPIWVEAIAPGGGEGPDAITELKPEADRVFFFSVPNEKIILRYLSAISEKHNRYEVYLGDGVIRDNDPYVIALNSHQVPFSTLDDDDIPNIVKAVLPFGEYEVTVDFKTNKIVDRGYSYREKIIKANQATVSTRIFLEKGYSGISGILFSDTYLLNCPQKLGEEFIFVHNPMAHNRLLQGWLPRGREYWVEGCRLCSRFWGAYDEI